MSAYTVFLDMVSPEVCTICKYSSKLVIPICHDLKKKHNAHRAAEIHTHTAFPLSLFCISVSAFMEFYVSVLCFYLYVTLNRSFDCFLLMKIKSYSLILKHEVYSPGFTMLYKECFVEHCVTWAHWNPFFKAFQDSKHTWA